MKSLNMDKLIFVLLLSVFCHETSGYWDEGTTTIRMPSEDTTPRTSFFRWQWTSFPRWWFWSFDWDEIDRRRRLNVMAGISIDFLCLSTAVLLNRRVLISSYNPYDPYMHRMTDMRIWALGRRGLHNTPYRYRVFQLTRLFPISGNLEHCHGPHCTHQPRHDISIIISHDQIYIYFVSPDRWNYAYRTVLTSKYRRFRGEIWFAGSGFEYMEHVIENYKIFYALLLFDDLVDCSVYIPKWWGKFICMRNLQHFAGVQDGGGLFDGTTLMGIGCFEIRINNDRIYAFTDLRYYIPYIHYYGHVYMGQYYEYAYPQWSVWLGSIFYDNMKNAPFVPFFQMRDDMYPLGK